MRALGLSYESQADGTGTPRPSLAITFESRLGAAGLAFAQVSEFVVQVIAERCSGAATGTHVRYAEPWCRVLADNSPPLNVLRGGAKRCFSDLPGRYAKLGFEQRRARADACQG